jgi:DNA-binding NarL/FixJ family response regulator
MLRVGLIESNNLLRSGRSLLIGSQPDLQIVFEESNPKSALERVGDYLVDVLVVNIKQHGYAGAAYITALRETLKSTGNKSSVLGFANFFSDETYREAILAGADDFVGMDADAVEFLSKMKLVSRADYRIEQKQLEKLFRKNSQLMVKARELEVALGALEPWQRNVTKRFLRGESDAAIAKEFDLARTRVSQTIKSLEEAGSVYTRNQLAIALMGKVS